jgi:hypothetical protein
MLKVIGTLLIVFCLTIFVFIQESDMFGKSNCTAATLHQQGKLVKIHLSLAPDYAKRSDIERIIIQQVCNIK